MQDKRRGTKTLLQSLLVSLLLTGALGAYRWRDRLSAMAWHLIHGNSVRVGNYSVPVPSQWLVYDIGSGTTLLRPIDSSMGILSIETRASGPVNVDGWAQFRKLALEKQGVEGIQEVRLNTQDQSIECVGGDEFKSDARVLKMPLPSLVLDCVAPGELWIEFMGQRGGLQTFAGIVSSIRRRP